jgi:hypothetical protein
MGPLFGMAGLAEAAFAQVAGMLCIGVILAFGAAFVTLAFRSRVAAVIGLAVWAILALWLQPWRDFWPEPSDDPDLQSFQATFQQLAWWWVAASSSLALAAVWAFWPRRRGGALAQQTQAEPVSWPPCQ